MGRVRIIQRQAILVASLAFHGVILTGLALNQARPPRLATPEDVFDVTVLPRYLTPRESSPRQFPVKKVPEKDQSQETLPVAPRVVDAAPSPTPSQATRPAGTITADQLGQALRNGGVGCNPPGLPGLSREAREICEARLAAGARTARYLGAGLAREKQAEFDRAAAPGNAWRRNVVPAEMGHTDVSAESALKRNQMAPGRPGDTQANWSIAGTPF